jgi:hypothetical protein
MAFDGSGTFTPDTVYASETPPIPAATLDDTLADLAEGLSNCLTRDGQGKPSAHIDFNGKKLTNMATPAASGDAATKGYVDGLLGSNGSFTATLDFGTGADVTATMKYVVGGGLASLYLDVDLDGDSATKSGTLTITGIPAACRPAAARKVACNVSECFAGDTPGFITVGTGGSATLGRYVISTGQLVDSSTFDTDSLGARNGLKAGWSVTYPL